MARLNNNGGSAHGENSASFEQSFSRLQEVVQKLSEGNLTLQQALGAFEEGMMLADSCAQMLDEAELRVKQVSERAMRDGSASVIEIDQRMRATPAQDDEPELLSFEIETIESVLLFDAPERQSRQVRGQGPTGAKDKARRNEKLGAENPQSTGSWATPNSGNPHSLDPLFDEDD